MNSYREIMKLKKGSKDNLPLKMHQRYEENTSSENAQKRNT